MKTRGEGRAHSEKQQKVVTPYEIRQMEREQAEREEREWAEKCGPVTVRRADVRPHAE